MENLVKQKRVRFSDPGQGESSSTRERCSPFQQIESFIGDLLENKVQNWLQILKQFSWQMSQDYVSGDSEFAAAVAAAAFAIYSLEEAEEKYRKKMREEIEISRAKSKTRKEDSITELPSSNRVTRRFSGKEMRNGGETSSRNSAEAVHKAQESTLPISRPSRSSSTRTMTPVDLNQRQQGILPRPKNVESKADAWERAQMEKINKRYEKMKSSILAWENERKMQAKLKMEKKKGEIEQRRTLNQQHYQNKIARIEHIAGGARVQAEEERRNKESEIKQKAKMIRSRGKAPVKCFCC